MYYAQINEQNVCIGVSSLARSIEVELPAKLIEIPEYDVDLLYRKYENNSWSSNKFLPEVPVSDKELLFMLGEATTSNLMTGLELQQAVNSIGQGVVEIMLNQQMGGM